MGLPDQLQKNDVLGQGQLARVQDSVQQRIEVDRFAARPADEARKGPDRSTSPATTPSTALSDSRRLMMDGCPPLWGTTPLVGFWQYVGIRGTPWGLMKTKALGWLVPVVAVFVALITLVAATMAAAKTPTRHNPAPNNSTQSALLQFYVCPADNCSGIKVFIDSASNHFKPSYDYSYCTKDETSTGSASPTHNGEIRTVSAVFKNEGDCFVKSAHNSWLIEVYKGNDLLGKGIMAITEDDAFSAAYYATCDPVHSPWSPVWDKSKLSCTKKANSILQVGIPGAAPTYPDCPSSGPQCYVDVTLLAGSNPTEGLVACGSFSISSQTCQGPSVGTKHWTVPQFKPKLAIGSFFDYKRQGSGTQAKYDAVATYGTTQAEIVGHIPSSGNSFGVTDAWTRASTEHYKTGDSAPAGAPGGPLYFYYDSKTFSTTVVMEGYLMRKVTATRGRRGAS